jgi:hypothetical protein
VEAGGKSLTPRSRHVLTTYIIEIEHLLLILGYMFGIFGKHLYIVV